MFRFSGFRDRVEAGRLLGEELKKRGYGGDNVLVLGIPRGGVVVAHEVAMIIDSPLDIIVSRKLGAPYNPELAIGAISEEGSIYIDKNIVNQLGVDEEYIREEEERQRKRMNNYLKKFRKNRSLNVSGKTVIIVDDGIATGSTMIAAIRAVRKMDAEKIICATPVVAKDILPTIKKECDKVIALKVPTILYAIGMFYQNFDQVGDEEVLEILRQYYPI